MDFLTGRIKAMYFKYLAAAFGSALISSIYGVVDMAIVGQYQGAEGTAALFGGIFNVFGDYFFVFILKMGIMGTAAVFGLIWTALAVFVPNFFVRIFMTPTEEILTLQKQGLITLSTITQKHIGILEKELC